MRSERGCCGQVSCLIDASIAMSFAFAAGPLEEAGRLVIDSLAANFGPDGVKLSSFTIRSA